MRRSWMFIIFFVTCFNGLSQAPAGQNDGLYSNGWHALKNNRSGFDRILIRRNDTLLFLDRTTCKGFYTGWLLDSEQVTLEKNRLITSDVTRTPFLRVQGNVQYDFLYRSYIDTPFSQHDFQQHTIQAFLNVTLKDKYPLKVNLAKRFSNSPFFKNFLDVNVQYDKNAFVRNEKQQLLSRITKSYWQKPDLARAEAALKQATDTYNKLKAALNAPDVLQRLVEEREKQYYQQQAAAHNIPTVPEIPSVDWNSLDKIKLYKISGGNETDSAADPNRYTKYIEVKKQELDSLERRIGALQSKRDSVKNKISTDLVTIRQKIYKAGSSRELHQIAQGDSLAEKKNSRFETFLANVKSVGIGRSVVNYSELTAWDVSLTGFNLEYNDRLYAALAVGKIDYGFRDFLGKNTRQKGQNFLMGRFGFGNVERKAIIVSAFTGKKYAYGGVVNDTVNDYVHIIGYSVEGILKKDEHTGISVEVAKTTKPVTGSLGNNRGMQSLFQYADNANLGINVKGQTLLSKTSTSISGFYRKTGAQFQSFSLFTYNTNQTAWVISVDQPFFNNKVGVIASLRRNDFTNPVSEKTFKTSTVFKSIQVNVRVPRWPSFTAGYFPGSQIYIIDKDRIRENAYYIINASVVHQYRAGGISMLSTLLYNRYAGKGTDSGFIAYSGNSYMASQTCMLQRLQLQGMYLYTDQEQMQYYTLDANGEYSITKWIRAGAGVKYNKVTGGNAYIGNNVHVGVDVQQLGNLQLQYERSYLPTIWQTLYPVETGRVTWIKYF
jgi:hypothetical protein